MSETQTNTATSATVSFCGRQLTADTHEDGYTLTLPLATLSGLSSMFSFADSTLVHDTDQDRFEDYHSGLTMEVYKRVPNGKTIREVEGTRLVTVEVPEDAPGVFNRAVQAAYEVFGESIRENPRIPSPDATDPDVKVDIDAAEAELNHIGTVAGSGSLRNYLAGIIAVQELRTADT